jgi:hypothetical protein
MILLTQAQVENFLIGAARGLLVGPRNQETSESDILVKRKRKNWSKRTSPNALVTMIVNHLLQDAYDPSITII